jgi:hypothetical protein
VCDRVARIMLQMVSQELRHVAVCIQLWATLFGCGLRRNDRSACSVQRIVLNQDRDTSRLCLRSAAYLIFKLTLPKNRRSTGLLRNAIRLASLNSLRRTLVPGNCRERSLAHSAHLLLPTVPLTSCADDLPKTGSAAIARPMPLVTILARPRKATAYVCYSHSSTEMQWVPKRQRRGSSLG